MKARKWLALVLTLALAVTLTACGGSSSEAADDMYYESSKEVANDSISTDSASGAVLPENRKLIRTISIDAETEELDPLLESLNQKVAQLGGYVENRNVYNGSSYSAKRYRYADLTIRIPAEVVDGFVEHVGGVSNVVSSNETIDDVTLTYVDTESRVQALETEQERLLAMMEQAEDLSDLLKIESRLTEVSYQLESVASRLRTLENQVSYATVELYISEVQEYTPVAEKTAWQRIAEGFVDSLEGIADGAVEVLVWVLANSPYLVLFGGIAAAVTTLLRKRKKPVKKAPRTDNPQE